MLWCLLVLVIALACVAHVARDIKKRKKFFQDQGLLVLHQWFHPAHILVNILPKRGFFLWLFPYRFPAVEEEISKLLLRDDVGGMMAVVAYGHQQVYTSHPDHIREIASSSSPFHKPDHFYSVFTLWGKTSIFSACNEGSGGDWQMHRDLIAPVFNRATYHSVVKSAYERFNAMSDVWRWSIATTPERTASVDMDSSWARLMLSVLGDALIGADLGPFLSQVGSGSTKTMTLRDHLKVCCENLFLRALLPGWVMRVFFSKAERSFKQMEVYMRELCAMPHTERYSLLEALSIEHIKVEDRFADLFILLAAGHETSAHTMAWFTLLLALHPEVQHKVSTCALCDDRTR